ncbi:MAG TPA: phosphoribosylformylglycinamidine synthase subunit PurS [Actinomycetota bacterium]|nr:phosphoribosylformylglycinamidine synthase subunit PurS [Actinomycetota bacterium]
MTKFAAHINVMPRAEISDPQGQTVERTLPSIGFDGISQVRVGKRITLTVDAPDEESARTIVASASEKILANPVIEDYELELTPL